MRRSGLPRLGHRQRRSRAVSPAGKARSHRAKNGLKTLFIFDEPTTGLHFDDINKLLSHFALIDGGAACWS